MQEHREEMLLKLQRLGCVEIADIDLSEQSDMPDLQSPDTALLSESKGQYQAGELALEILDGYNKASGGLAPREVISEQRLFGETERAKAWEYISQITEGKAEIATLLGEQTGLLQKKESLEPWRSLELPLETESTESVTVQFGSFPLGTDVNVVNGKLTAATDLAELTLGEARKDGVFALLTC